MSAEKADVGNDKRKRDPYFINAEIALKRAAQAGIGVIVLKNGQITEELPDT